MITYTHIGLNILPLFRIDDYSARFDVSFGVVDRAVVRRELLDIPEVTNVEYINRFGLRITLCDMGALNVADAYTDCVKIMKDIDRVEYLLRDMSESVFALLDEDY